ncbi:hypothetical protein BE221DRAFT_194621 [Ostreococcus tauri]|uniref:RRM domain-containing protein n=2 Tax=Ostreococcus tauri TaxID=70448 RepID=A0A1Y5I107_OSTTA|nr:hypothetical protein BE221DRAFT_194621 [Ostreococcus tauri]
MMDAMKTTTTDDATPDGGARARENVMVFVRNLPYDADDKAVLDVFSDAFGPVKECWTVAERGTGTRRGFGYVKFAIPEDARAAVEASGTITLNGRKLGVSMARPKEREGGERGARRPAGEDGTATDERKDDRGGEVGTVKTEGTNARAKTQRSKATAGGGKDAPRTVVIGGLKLGGEIEGVDADAAKALARKVGAVKSFIEPCPETVMKSAKIREDGCKRGALLVVYKDEATAREAVKALHGQAPKSKKQRKNKKNDDENDETPKETIWARTLGGEGSKPKQWRVIVRNLSFKATEASIREAMSAAGFVWDVNVPKDFHDKPKGFAFVTYTSKADSDKAVSDCNGVSIEGRQVAVDIALAKSKFREEQDAAANNATEDKDNDKDGASDEDLDDGSDSDGSDDSDSSSSSSSSSEKDEETRDKSMVSRLLGKMISKDQPPNKVAAPKKAEKKAAAVTEAKADGVEPAWQGKKGVDMQSGDAVENATVFVRNLPLEATWQQLKEKMEKFGKVKSCRVVKDKTTGKHVGNAFVDFTNPDSANAAVEAGAQESAGIFVAGRPITVALALSKTEAQDMMARQGSKYRNANKHRDNRNLYLASEGDIHEASAAADGVSKSDIEKRRRANEERQLKLKNPNFFVSRTRLSVRNIPPEMDSKTLKKMFIEAVQKRATHAAPKVMHAKLLYDSERMDENGKPKNKGIGFVEFSEHEHALTALRALNNNPDAFTRARRPIVEFAIEDARAVRKLELKAKRRDEITKKRSEEGDKPRGAEQAAKRVAAKEKRSGEGPMKKRLRDGDQDKPHARPNRDTDTEPRAKKGKSKREDAKSNAASKLQQRAAAAQKRERRDERPSLNDEAPGRRKKHIAEKRDRTDDLIDAYFSKDSGTGGLKSWL